MNTNKRKHQCAVRTTITLPPILFDAAQEIIRRAGYVGLSDYLQAKIRVDAGFEMPKQKAA